MRLVPRFSLRFALLALTIFLLVFGVGVKYWRDYQEHERLAKLFHRNDIRLEDEPITFRGYFLGKRATGLRVESSYAEASDLELLRQLPTRRDVRRLSFVGGKNLKQQLPQIMEMIMACPGLEALELQDFELTAKALQELQQLRQLEYLSLRDCTLPAEARFNFSGMTSLKTLLLKGASREIDVSQLLQSELPQLEYFSLTGGKFDGTLDLTRAGFGRFPQLQYLVLNWNDFEQLKCEAHALPRLRYLDLTDMGAGTTIPWQELVRLAPNLEALSINAQQLNAESITALASWKRLAHLEYYHFDYRDKESTDRRLVEFQTPFGSSWINQAKLNVAAELVKQCPELQLHQPLAMSWIQNDWRRDFLLPERDTQSPFMRESGNWRH